MWGVNGAHRSRCRCSTGSGCSPCPPLQRHSPVEVLSVRPVVTICYARGPPTALWLCLAVAKDGASRPRELLHPRAVSVGRERQKPRWVIR